MPHKARNLACFTLRARWHACLGMALAGLCAQALAQNAQGPQAAAAGDAAPAAVAPPPKTTAWEGAIGLTTAYRPEYAGGSRQIVKLTPALFVRYGRFTITNASGFVTRRADDVMRGLGVDMVQSDRLRINVSLRIDRGRAESTSQDLAGLGDIRPTVRARTAASWRLEGPWRLGASWSFDALGRGGGNHGDVGGGWEHRLSPATVITLGSSLSLAGDRYMQTYFGISAEQAARSRYPVYTPKAGVRDVSVSANLRHDFAGEWIALAGVTTTRLLGPAAASPLTGKRDNWGLSAGLARRF